MGFSEAVSTCLRKFVDFTGRAPRSEYWWFYLFVVLVVVGMLLLDTALLGHDPDDPGSLPVLTLLAGAAFFLPILSAGVRRLHDSNRSGWWLLIALIPIVGGLIQIVLLALPGTPGPNRFGENPLGAGAAA